MVGLTVRLMVTVDGGDAAASTEPSTSTGHEAYSSAPAHTHQSIKDSHKATHTRAEQKPHPSATFRGSKPWVAKRHRLWEL